MRTRLYSLLALLALSMVAWPSTPSSAAAPQPVFQYEETITGNGTHKFPSAAVAKGKLHVVWATPNQANHAMRAETAQGFVASPPLGSIGSNSSFFNHSVTADPGGNIHAVWIEERATVRHRSYTGAAWSETHTAAVNQNFANNLSAAAASTGRIFAAWRHDGSNPQGHIAFIFSDNGGVSWSAPVDVALPTGTYAGLVRLAGGPNGQMFMTWTGGDGNVYVGEWNGSTFVPTKISNGTDFFNSTISVTSSGQPVVAWRSVGSGVHYGYRNASGQWITENLYRHNGVTGPVNIVADAQNNLHLAWISQQAGNSLFQVWYSFKTPNDPWTAPMVASHSDAAFKANLNMTTTLTNGTALAHIVWESFAGGQFIRYAQVKTQVFVPLSGSLTINNGARYTKNRAVNVAITNTSPGQATVFSIADGVDPGTPAAPFTNPTTNTTFNLNTADGLCRQHTVYARLGNGSDVSPLFGATIIYDPFARIIAQARNPNAVFSQPLNDFNSAAVPSGDPAYTREERFNLSVIGGLDECSGIKRYAIVKKGVAKPAATDPAWHTVSGGYVSANVQFAATNGQATYEFDVYGTDMVDNETTTAAAVQVIYDTEAPSVTGASATMPATGSTKGGVATITVGTPSVSDNLYPGQGTGKQYWGYWVVVKRTAAGAPSTVDWESYGAVRAGMLPSTLRWNMVDGLVGTFLRDSDYTVYIRHLDGAGNASTPMSSQPVRVRQLEYFTHVPISSR